MAKEAKESPKKSQDYSQRTLVVLKPDTVQRGIIGEVI